MLTLTANKIFFLQKLFIKKFDTVVSWSSQGEWIIWLFVLRLIIRNLKVEQQEKRNDHHQKLSRPSSNNKQKFKLAQAHYETIRLNVCRSVWPRLTQHGNLDILNTKKALVKYIIKSWYRNKLPRSIHNLLCIERK